MTHSDYLPKFKPKQPTSFARPVLFESAVAGPLCGAELPDRTGCLVWVNGSNVRFAHTPSTASWLVDGSVTAGMAGTALAAPGGDISGGTTVFVAAGNLYLIVGYLNAASRYIVALYKANSVTLPTSWSHVSDLHNTSATGPAFGNHRGIGHPLILDTGRWVYGTMVTESTIPEFQAAVWRVFLSDNAGLSWTNPYTYSHPYPGFPRTQFASPHIGTDPATGNLWGMSGTITTGPEHQIALHRSTDNGSSWSILHASGYPYTNPRPMPCINNGEDLIACDATYYLFRRYLTGSDGFPDETRWPSYGVNWVAPGITTDDETSARQRIIVAPGERAAYFFVRDQVMRVAAGPFWWVGEIGMA